MSQEFLGLCAVLLMTLSCQRASDSNRPVDRPATKRFGQRDGWQPVDSVSSEGVVECLEKLQDDPGSVSVRLQLGKLLLDRNDWLSARQQFAEIDALEPGHADANYQLGNIAIELEQLDAAKSRFQQAVAAQADHVPARMALADVWAAEGFWLEAAGHWRQVLNYDPTHTEAKRLLANSEAKTTLEEASHETVSN